MDDNEIRTLLDGLKHELDDAQRQQSLILQKMRLLQGSIENLEGLLDFGPRPMPAGEQPELPSLGTMSRNTVVQVGPSLTISEGIKLILEENSRVWSLPDLIAELRVRGWMPPVKNQRESVRNAANYLAEVKKEILRPTRTSYRRIGPPAHIGSTMGGSLAESWMRQSAKR